jgi:GTP1/Obg family GTP-binding protein
MTENSSNAQKEYLQDLLEKFTKTQVLLSEKVERQKELLSRKSSNKWTQEKKKKAQSRLTSAIQELNQTLEIISQIEIRLSQL